MLRYPLLFGLLAILSGGATRAQDNSGPWHDCDFPTIGITVDTNALLPAIEPGRRLTALCFTHAIRGSSLTAGQVRLELLSPPLRRGDLVLFRRPDDNTKTTIRRVIGMPGDRVQLRDYRLLVNDTLLPTDRLGELELPDGTGGRVRVVRLHETMNHAILGYDVLIPMDATDGSGGSQPFTVPPRTIYVLPDNRAMSQNFGKSDAGMVPVVNLIALLRITAAK